MSLFTKYSTEMTVPYDAAFCWKKATAFNAGIFWRHSKLAALNKSEASLDPKRGVAILRGSCLSTQFIYCVTQGA